MATASSQEHRLYDYEATANYLNTSVRHVRNLYATGRLSAVKVGKLVRFDRSDLEEFIERNRVR